MSLNNEPCMLKRFLIDLNLFELNYYPFMTSLDQFSGNCNFVDDLTTKICVPSKTKDVNVKVLNMITKKKNEAKTMVKHISCDCKCKFNSTTCNSNQKWNNETCQCECKHYHKCKTDYGWCKCVCENGKYLKSINDNSKIACDEIIYVMNNVPPNVSKNSDDKKVRNKMDCYILHTVLLVIILLFTMAIICYQYAKHRSKLKKHFAVLKI